jgi:hypothetical protein
MQASVQPVPVKIVAEGMSTTEELLSEILMELKLLNYYVGDRRIEDVV